MLTSLWTAVLAFALIVARDAFWRWWTAYCSHTSQAKPQDAALLAAVQDAATAIGMNGPALTLDSDLVASGKVFDVLHQAAIALGKDHQLRTVRDLCDWLAEAPANDQTRTPE